MSLNVLVLESVGSCIDTEGMVYPLNVDDTPDTNCGSDWLDTTDEWSESLSEEDAGLLNDWLLENNYSVDVNDDELEGTLWEGCDEWETFVACCDGTNCTCGDDETELLMNDVDDGSWEGR